MAYVFRIHDANPNNPKATKPVPAANVADWAATGYIQGNLIENIDISNTPRKMGTSIPSFFSRIFLFQGAFSTLGNNVSTHNNVTPDTKLVSECFDLLEFLFQNGQSDKLIIRHWNATNQIQNLRGDGKAEHQRLATILSDEIKSYPELQDLYLFYWRSVSSKTQATVEHLIGGTSPYTLVFTSPNWKRHMQESGWSFNRLNQTPMFDDKIQALSKRASVFKDMIYGLYNAFAGNMNKADGFKNYCNLAWNNESAQNPVVVGMANNPGAFYGVYTLMNANDNTKVMSLNVPIVYKAIVSTNSDYSIVCTASRYKTYNYENANIQLQQVPLVLNDAGIPNASYVGTTQWNPALCKINEAAVRGIPMHQRTLPGDMGVKAPFIIASDFLEDNIIKLPYGIDASHFITAFNGESHYLLPLRLNFFNYFNVDDLDSIVDTQGNKMLTIREKQSNVEVTLRIPVAHKLPNAKYNSVIELTKVYADTSIIYSEQTDLHVGIFPFYRVIDIPTPQNAGDHNKYAIALAGLEDISLQFYNIEEQEIIAPKGNLRYDDGNERTTYYDVNKAFDAVCINVDNHFSLLIPKFKKILQKNITDSISVAIDFGTSNTYIATKRQNAAPVPLTIDNVNPQVVYINATKNDDDEVITAIRPILNREFIPTTIGQNSSTCSFPMRTATCELKNFVALQPILFANVSVGFNYENETVKGSITNFNYITDLKWALERDISDKAYLDRVSNYFKGLLWIIKNHCLLNDCGLPQNIYITYPEAMVVPTRNALETCWQYAFRELNLKFNEQYVRDNESIAPYHAMAQRVMGASHMNIDIGGGTSDILYVVKNNGQIQRAYFCSTKFAADDLWGDGISIVKNGNSTTKDNGFKSYLEESIGKEKSANYDEKKMNEYNGICKFAQNSSDIMSFLFKNNDIFQTSLKIQGQQNLYSLIFIHFAATLYNVARILKNKKLTIPEVLTFTGLGSKYTEMISVIDDDLKGLAKILLEVFTDTTAPKNFSVIREPNSKEVTANGALIGPTLNATYQVSKDILERVFDYGYDTTDTIQYQDVANNEIKNSVIEEYKKFINILRTDKDIKNYLQNNFNHQIKDSLLQDLEDKATTSYQNVCGNMIQHKDVDVNETLFFWPLKHALYEVSKNYQSYI